MDIPRRNVSFPFEDVPRDWANADAYETTFLNALSLLFPEGEQFFVRSVKAFADQIQDPDLARAVQGFVGQEAMHGREHRHFNDLLVAHGYTEAPAIDHQLKRFLAFIRQRVLSPSSQLAVTTALEHFTAMLAEELLGNRAMLDAIHPSMRSLWAWHALEESEHKAVAFDVYQTIDGSYRRRAAIMVLTTAVFFAVLWSTHVRLMATRKVLWKPWRWLRGMTRFYVVPGFLSRLVPAYLAYYKPSFHPNERDTTALLATWREQLFGANGSLAA
ncbi:MAG TPA: metal-dependent hydrolase [Kofleriaceae bacterium]